MTTLDDRTGQGHGGPAGEADASPVGPAAVGSPGVSGRTLTTIILGTLTGLVLVLTMTGFAGGWWWVFDIFAGYRFQLAVVALVLAAIALPTRHWIIATLSVMALVVNGVLVAPLYLDGQPSAAPAAPALTIEHLNMQGTSNDPRPFVDSLAANPADVIVLLEPGGTWVKALGSADVGGYRSYPLKSGPGHEVDVILLARVPVAGLRRPADPALPVPSVEFSVKLDGRDVEVLGMHTLSPKNGSRSMGRDRQLEAVASWTNSRQGPAVVLGDLNSTPWSHAFRALIDATDLRNSQDGYGFEPTWPVQNWFMRVPIDQSLCTQDLTAVGRSLGSGFGSGHRSLTVRYAFR